MIAETVVIIIISFLLGCVIGAANLSMTKIESIENYYNANNANKKRKNTKINRNHLLETVKLPVTPIESAANPVTMPVLVISHALVTAALLKLCFNF